MASPFEQDFIDFIQLSACKYGTEEVVRRCQANGLNLQWMAIRAATLQELFTIYQQNPFRATTVIQLDDPLQMDAEHWITNDEWTHKKLGLTIKIKVVGCGPNLWMVKTISSVGFYF